MFLLLQVSGSLIPHMLWLIVKRKIKQECKLKCWDENHELQSLMIFHLGTNP